MSKVTLTIKDNLHARIELEAPRLFKEPQVEEIGILADKEKTLADRKAEFILRTVQKISARYNRGFKRSSVTQDEKSCELTQINYLSEDGQMFLTITFYLQDLDCDVDIQPDSSNFVVLDSEVIRS